MARINIEDSLYKDQRFTDLCIAFGSKFTALGALVALWTLGQEYWKRDKSLIPKHKWNEQRLPKELLQLGFVIEKEHGFEVDGAEKQFSWIVQRVVAGKIGGDSKNRYLEPSEEQRDEADRNEAQPPPPPLTPTHSLSPSISPYSPPAGEEEFQNAFEKLQAGIERTTNIRIIAGSHAHKRFLDFIIKPKKLTAFLEAIDGYLAMLAHEQDRTPKKSLETFIGTKRSGFYWAQWRGWKAPESTRSPRPGGGLKTFAQQTIDANQQTWTMIDQMEEKHAGNG